MCDNRPFATTERTGTPVQVLVRDNNVDQALRALKKKMQREGIFREMKMRGHYEKPSEKRAREKAEAVRRARKLARKRAQREGILPGGTRAAALTHQARTICRRAERRVWHLVYDRQASPETARFLNRLSDALFLLARLENHLSGILEQPWEAP